MTLAPPDSCAPMLEFALDYARRGWPVFPCKPTSKAPFVKDNLNAATSDESTIRKWWKRWPHAMIGVSVWAVDPDPPKTEEEPDGREIWAEVLSLLAQHRQQREVCDAATSV